MNAENLAPVTEDPKNGIAESSDSLDHSLQNHRFTNNPAANNLPADEINSLVNWNASLKANLDRLERAIILAALHNAHGNRARAARALGITERIMGLRVRKYRINARAIRTVGYDAESEHTNR